MSSHLKRALRAEDKGKGSPSPRPSPPGEGGAPRSTLHVSRFTFHVSRFTPHASRAFTLIEILVTIGLLSFIVLGLMAMFHQTQRAFRAGMTQTEVLEAGRNVSEMIARELEQMTPAYRANETNFIFGFYALAKTRQAMPGSDQLRTNVPGYLVFLSGQNTEWTGIGYIVQDLADGGGTLYRYSTNRSVSNPASLSEAVKDAIRAIRANTMNNLPVTNYTSVAEGVVHMQVRAFAPNGFPIVGLRGLPVGVEPDPTATNPAARLHYCTNVLSGRCSTIQTSWALGTADLPDGLQVCCFFSNAVPAYLELELGILEPQIYERYKAIGRANPVAQETYLSNHVAQVHLFRQRIPIRNVDSSAYP